MIPSKLLWRHSFSIIFVSITQQGEARLIFTYVIIAVYGTLPLRERCIPKLSQRKVNVEL
jgi:hypothetical protein